MRNGFLLHNEQAAFLEAMTDEQAGKLMKRVFAYVSTGEEGEESDPAVKFAFIAIKMRLDADNQKYQQKCEKNRESGRLGGRPPLENGSNEKRSVSAESERLNQNPSDIDSDIDLDSESKKKAEEKGTPLSPPVEPKAEPPADAQKAPPTPRKRGSKGEAIIYTQSFEAFWAVYPNPKGKAKAFESWEKIPKKHVGVGPTKIIQAVQAQVAAKHFHNLDGESNPPHPATWLNQARWDDVVKPAQAPPGPALTLEQQFAALSQGGPQ